MARNQVGEIRINKRTVQIGRQVYSLANISRVQSGQLVRGRRGAQAVRLVTFLILVTLVAGLIMAESV